MPKCLWIEDVNVLIFSCNNCHMLPKYGVWSMVCKHEKYGVFEIVEVHGPSIFAFWLHQFDLFWKFSFNSRFNWKLHHKHNKRRSIYSCTVLFSFVISFLFHCILLLQVSLFPYDLTYNINKEKWLKVGAMIKDHVKHTSS